MVELNSRPRRKPSDDIIVLAIRAMSGEITPNMRLIALQYDNRSVKFVFYMADEPSEDERECGEIIAVNFESGLPHVIDKLDIEFVVTNEPPGKLDTLDFVLYSRWEPV